MGGGDATRGPPWPAVPRRGGLRPRRRRAERRGRDGARCSVLTAAAAEPVTASRQSPAGRCERAVAMPRSSCTSSLLSLLSLCVVCVYAAAVVPSPKSFRSANLTAAALLSAREYGKTVLATDDVLVAVQEYADCAVFRVQARARGFVALGFADRVPAPSVDVLLLWVDDETGTGRILVSAGRLTSRRTVRF